MLSFTLGRPGIRWITRILVCISLLFVASTLFIGFYPPRFIRDYGLHVPLPRQRPPISTSVRAERVREAFIHAYHGYRNQAFPFDELSPVDGGKVNKLGQLS
jgi:hypothetical protein